MRSLKDGCVHRKEANTPMNRYLTICLLAALLFSACSPQRSIHKQTDRLLLKDGTIGHAHLGISIYDPAESKYLYNYQGDQFFVPASNTKIITCYAALKYLGDSLAGIRYWQNDTAIYLIPTGDPTLLHSDFKKNPVIDLLQKTTKKIYITDANWKDEALGSGWSWDDYNDDYLAERSALPVYGNVLHWVQERLDTSADAIDKEPSVYSMPEINWKVRFNPDNKSKSFFIQRNRDENVYTITQGIEKKKEQDVPFVTHGIQSAIELLPDTVGKEVLYITKLPPAATSFSTVHSQPLDSVLRPMMHRSDNFFAEQVLLMVSNKMTGVMNDARITDSLLRTDLKDLPQRPRWVDGSGLSRFNLFTPQCFVNILNKMQQDFGMNRLKVIFPTGGRGTLANYYKRDSGSIYAKTGTLSGVVSISGFLYTKKNKLLIFSVLINNHNGSATTIRRKVEEFLEDVRNRY